MTDSDYPGRTTCPRCGAVVPESPLWATWCDQCDWNVDAGRPETPKQPFLDRARQRIVDRAAERARRRAEADPDWFHHPPSRLPELALSLVALAGYAGVAAVGVLAALDRLPVGFWRWPLAVLCGLVVWALWPRGTGFAATDIELGSDECPALYETAGLVAGGVHVAAPSRAAVNLGLRIAVRAHGLRGEPVLLVGLPVWSAASWGTRAAMLAHDVAHLRGRRTPVGQIVAVARRLCWDAVHLMWPSEGAVTAVRLTVRPLSGVANALQRGFALPLVGFALLLDRVGASARLHAEYRADLDSARAAGTRAAVAALTSLMGVESLLVPVGSAVRRGEDPWAALEAPPSRPAREIERLRRASRTMGHHSDPEHPPTWMRIELLVSAPDRGPEVVIPADLRTRVDAEIAALQQRLADDLRDQVMH